MLFPTETQQNIDQAIKLLKDQLQQQQTIQKLLEKLVRQQSTQKAGVRVRRVRHQRSSPAAESPIQRPRLLPGGRRREQGRRELVGQHEQHEQRHRDLARPVREYNGRIIQEKIRDHHCMDAMTVLVGSELAEESLVRYKDIANEVLDNVILDKHRVAKYRAWGKLSASCRQEAIDTLEGRLAAMNIPIDRAENQWLALHVLSTRWVGRNGRGNMRGIAMRSSKGRRSYPSLPVKSKSLALSSFSESSSLDSSRLPASGKPSRYGKARRSTPLVISN